jgi:uncharacterized membrane protein YvbJ
MPTCHKCGQENPEAARFCYACGTPAFYRSVGAKHYIAQGEELLAATA